MDSGDVALGAVVLIVVVALIGGSYEYTKTKNQEITEIRFTEMVCPVCGTELAFGLEIVDEEEHTH